MFIYLLQISILVVAIAIPLFFPVKKKNTIKIPKNCNDTSNARYAINENGFLEEINHDKLSQA